MFWHLPNIAQNPWLISSSGRETYGDYGVIHPMSNPNNVGKETTIFKSPMKSH